MLNDTVTRAMTVFQVWPQKAKKWAVAQFLEIPASFPQIIKVPSPSLAYESTHPTTWAAFTFEEVLLSAYGMCIPWIRLLLLYFGFLFIYFNINLFILIGGKLLYNIVLVLPYINMN